MDLTYWYLFPVAIAIAAIARGAGVGGATFFSPLFIIVLGLEPAVAIGTALVTEVFGFASGVVGRWRKRTIDWEVVRMLAVASIPAGVVGSLIDVDRSGHRVTVRRSVRIGLRLRRSLSRRWTPAARSGRPTTIERCDKVTV